MSIPLRLNGARASACGVCSAGDAHSIRIFCTCNSRCSASSKCKRVSPKTALKPLVREQAPLLLIGITKAFAANCNKKISRSKHARAVRRFAVEGA